MKYSFTTKGFYEDYRTDLPSDCVDISETDWQHLVTEQSNGARIVHNDTTLPALEYPADPTAEIIEEQVKLLRAQAYRNEADPLFFKAQRGEITQQEWLDKVAEIKLRDFTPMFRI